MVNKENFDISKMVLHFGLDHLEIYGTFLNEKELFESLDFDNSNYGEFENYTFIKTEVPKYTYKIIFNKDNYTTFAYYKGKPKNKTQTIATIDYIVIYSTAFKILSIEEILYFLQYFELRKCRRFDICIDLKANIKDILNTFKETKQKNLVISGEKGNAETKYIGELQRTQNKRQLIRIYNKLLDLKIKKKINLYVGYFDYKDVTRIELEIRQELAKNINYLELFNNQEKLYGIFKNYLGRHTNVFNFIEINKVSLYRKSETIDPEKYQSLYYRNYKKNIFVGHGKTIFNLGFCPIRILIAEGLIQEKSKKLIGVGNIEDLYKKEIKARQEAREDKYIDENWQEILHNLYKYGKI